AERSTACGWAREKSPAYDIGGPSDLTSADASGALGPASKLGCQARDLAQLLGHFLESFRRLLRGHLRFRDPAGQHRIALPFGFKELQHFLGLRAAGFGVRQTTGQFLHPLLFARELLRQLLRAT